MATVIRLDIEKPAQARDTLFVQSDAARLPFRDKCFDVVISNHSLEHMEQLHAVLHEIGRVVCPSGSLYVAVPDSSTFSDRLYRWVYHGGGHVNPFSSLAGLEDLIRRHVSLPPAGARILHTSFGFLERSHFRPRPPRRMWLFGNGQYWLIAMLGYISRLLDKFLHTRLSIYGWAIYFGRTAGAVDRAAWTNVCVQCGSAQPAGSLRPQGFPAHYDCPSCGAWNLFTNDSAE